jgi:2'-5' RNA ligase
MGNVLKPSDPEDLHLTLKFLGDTRWEQTADVARRVKSAAGSQKRFSLKLSGVGAFPSADRPNVLWVGAESGGVLEQLAGDLDQQLTEVGFLPEARAFHPHVTLARVKASAPPGLSEWIQRLGTQEFGTVDIEQIELFQSELRDKGPRYTSLATAKLAR